MFKRILNLIICLLLLIFSSGCLIPKSKSPKKASELDDLVNEYTSNNNDVYTFLTDKSKGQSSEIEKLKAEKSDLEKMLLSKSEEFTKDKAECEEKLKVLSSKKEQEVQELNKTYKEMIKKMKSEIASGQVTISKLPDKLKVTILESIFFDLGKAEIKPEGMAALKKIIDILKKTKNNEIRVEGHTDDLKISGELAKEYPTNWELSSARAIKVVRYIQNHGINPEIISAVAFGQYRPITTNDTVEGRAKNRRIEIILIPNGL